MKPDPSPPAPASQSANSQIQDLALQTHLVFLEEYRKCLQTRADAPFLKDQMWEALMEAVRKVNLEQGVVR